MFRGLLGVAVVVLVAQVAALAVLAPGHLRRTPAWPGSYRSAPWFLTIFGSGLLGMWARKPRPATAKVRGDSHYESARQLLTQLRAVTRRLSAGLDSEGMAAQLMATMQEHLDDSFAAVFVKMRGSILVPLGYRGLGAQQLLLPNDDLVERCWADARARGRRVPPAAARRATGSSCRCGWATG